MADTGNLSKAEIEEQSCVNPLQNYKNPLELSPVIRSICKFLNLQDIKNCRFLSLEWNSNASFFLRARSKIIFSTTKRKDDTNEKVNFSRPYTWNNTRDFVPSKFIEEFSDTLHIPFTAFRIDGGRWSRRLFNELNMFFHNHQDNIQELELGDGLSILDQKKAVMKSFNIFPWIMASGIIKQNSKYDTKLSVGSPLDQSSTHMVVSLSILIHTKNVSLNGCLVHISEIMKIRPRKLTMHNVRFGRYGNIELLKEILINDIVDFSKLESFDWLSVDIKNCCLILDLNQNTGPVRLRILKLDNHSWKTQAITVLNWSVSEWIVDHLDVHGVSLLEKIEMQIFKVTFRYAQLDLFALPQSIESLSIVETVGCGPNNRVFCSQPISLQNLTDLQLEFVGSYSDSNFRSLISHFRNCSKLFRIHCKSFKRATLNWKLKWIPKSVKIIKLTNVELSELDPEDTNDVLNLNKLILKHHTISEAKRIFEHNILVNDLVLDCKIIDRDEQRQFLEFLTCKRDSIKRRVYVGPVYWDQWFETVTYSEDPMKCYVDKAEEYYVFEDMKGRAITETEFLILMEQTAD